MTGPEQDVASSPVVKGPSGASASPARVSRPIGRAGAARALQASLGNAAVARLLQRDDSSGGVAPPTPATTAPADQSSAGGTATPGTPDFKKLIADKDTSGIRKVSDFTAADPADRISMIHILIEDTWWVGDSDRKAIMSLWDAFGQKGILDAYAQNEALWDACVEHKVNLGSLPALEPYRTRFGEDVKAVADVYLDKNHEAVKAERGRLNLGGTDDLLKVGGDQAPPGKEIIEVQQLAREIQRADDVIKGLYEVPIGTTEITGPPPGTATGDRSSAGGTPATPAGGGAGGDSSGGPGSAPADQKTTVDVLFVPDQKVPPGGPAKGREKEFRSYDDVLKQFRAVTAARAILASRNPALFAASNGKPGEAGRIAQMSPREAATTLGRALNDTEQAIERAGPMIHADQIDWRDFTPIHQKLWDGMPSASKLPWNSKLAQSVAKDVIGAHQATQFWTTLGLGSLAAAAFIFSEIATGGMATFLWASVGTAAGAGQAAISVQNYQALATAAQTATSANTQLVGNEQVSEAQAAAVLDTAFAFLDVLTAAKGVVGGVKAAAAEARGAARQGLAGLAALTPEKAAEAIRAAVREIGPQETLRRAGMSADDVVKLAGGEATAEGKALRAASLDASVARPPGAGIAGLPAYPPTALGRRLAAGARGVYDRWAALATPEARLSALLDLLNPEMDRLGAPRLASITTSKVLLGGELTSGEWAISLRTALLEGAQPSTADFEALWGLVAHEFEHGKQWFEVAQMNFRLGPTEIANKLGIPDRVAMAACEVQSGARRGVRLVQGTAEWALVGRFDQSLLGGASQYRDALLATLERTVAEQTAAEAAFKPFEKLPPSTPGRQQALARFERAQSAYNVAETAYVQLPEEVAAYAAGGAAQSSLAERNAILKELHEASIEERAAAESMTRINEQMVALETAPGGIPYRVTMDFYEAAEKVDAALAQITEASQNLAKAAAGQAP